MFALFNVFIVVPCILVCHTNKLKKQLFYNYLLKHHYKSIVLIIRERHVLTLHLSTANWRIKLTTGCCCKNAATLHYTHYAIFYQIESYHSSSSCGRYSMHFDGTINLLYSIEMLPRTVSPHCMVNNIVIHWLFGYERFWRERDGFLEKHCATWHRVWLRPWNHSAGYHHILGINPVEILVLLLRTICNFLK